MMFKVHLPAIIPSPVAHVVRLLPNAIGNLAPERIGSLNRLTEGLTLTILDQPEYVCRADPNSQACAISIGTVEILWCQSYASWVFYSLELAGQIPSPKQRAISHPDVLRALDLYRWSLQRVITGSGRSPWPAHLGQPNPNRGFASSEHVADELTLLATSYMLIHELGHIELEHKPGGVSLDQERDADRWAADWVLGGDRIIKNEVMKRALGVALALMLLVATGVHGGDFGGKTHPRAYDRLFNALVHRVPREIEEPWAMIVALLSLHLTAKGFPVPTGPFDTFFEAVDAMITQLATLDQTST